MERTNYYRQLMLETAVRSGRGHLGGAFSVVEILVAIKRSMDIKDKLILSKGHAGIALYAIFQEENLHQFCVDESLYSEHPSIYTPGIGVTTGSLGHGLGIACGIALARKLNNEDGTIYVVLGDGECMEGSVYEAVMFACIHKLDNLRIIIDHNGVMSTAYLPVHGQFYGDVFQSMGCKTQGVYGHDVNAIQTVLDAYYPNRPSVVVARTRKGYGVSFMVNTPEWHNGVPKGEQLELARRELAND